MNGPGFNPETLDELAKSALWVILIGVLCLSILLSVCGWALYRAGERRLTAALVTALGILALGSIVTYAIGGEARAEAVALASLAIGALAATLGQLASRPGKPEPLLPEPPTDTPDDTPAPPTTRPHT